MGTVREAAREIEVFEAAEVVVVGGGPAGFGAAVAAGRAGADVLLVERYGHLGGLATGGIVCEMDCENDHEGRTIVGGVGKAMLERLDAAGGVVHDGWKRQTHPELLKCVADEMALEAGARVLLHTFAVGVLVEGGRITHLVTESKAGRKAIAGKVFVDATGDADVAFWAGVPCDYDTKPIGVDFILANVDREEFRQYVEAHNSEYLEFYNGLVADGGMSLSTMMTPIVGGGWIDARGVASVPLPDGSEAPVSGLDPRHLTYVEMEMRRRMSKSLPAYRADVPGYRNAELVSIACQTGVRETRRVRGEYVLTLEDCTSSRQFQDNIGLGGAWDTPGIRYGIPYRSLVPSGCENVLVAGRCASTDHGAQEYTRVILMGVVMGEACGIAASMAGGTTGNVRGVDVETLQSALAGNGVILD